MINNSLMTINIVPEQINISAILNIGNRLKICIKSLTHHKKILSIKFQIVHHTKSIVARFHIRFLWYHMMIIVAISIENTIIKIILTGRDHDIPVLKAGLKNQRLDPIHWSKKKCFEIKSIAINTSDRTIIFIRFFIFWLYRNFWSKINRFYNKIHIVSIWWVCGNISTGCSDFNLNHSLSNNSISLAMVVGLHEM